MFTLVPQLLAFAHRRLLAFPSHHTLSPATNMALGRFPPELLSSILQFLDSPHDLLSLIIASSPCQAVFSNAPTLFLTSVLQNAVEPSAMPHALAAFHLTGTTSPHSASADRVIDEYFGKCSFKLPEGRQGLSEFCQLHGRISFLIDDYAARAMDTLGVGSPTAPVLPLSSTEKARFQRAFYRYELFCLLFPATDWSDGPSDPVPIAEAQFRQFLAHLKVWEVEEMSCVHLYYVTLVRGFVDHIEDQLVAAALSVAIDSSQYRGSATHDSSRRQRQPHSASDDAPSDWELSSEGSNSAADYPIYTMPTETSVDDEHTASFDFLAFSSLLLFAKDSREDANDYVGYFASFGSLAVYQLSLSDEDRRRSMLRKFGYPSRVFLPQAIDAARQDAFAGMNPAQIQAHIAPALARTVNDDSSSCVNSGLEVFELLKSSYPVPFRLGSSRSFLRQRAYVFWDSARIYQNDEVTRNIREAASPGTRAARQLFDRRRRLSVEDRLEGIRVPRADMRRLEREFAPRKEYAERMYRVMGWRELWDLELDAMNDEDGQ